MNGPLKFLTARKILPLLESMICSQNLNECSLARARTSSCGSESKGHKRNNYIEQPYRTLLYRHKCFTTKISLQNSPYFCVFKCARAVKQKVWNEAEARARLLRYALPISLLIRRRLFLRGRKLVAGTPLLTSELRNS